MRRSNFIHNCRNEIIAVDNQSSIVIIIRIESSELPFAKVQPSRDVQYYFYWSSGGDHQTRVKKPSQLNTGYFLKEKRLEFKTRCAHYSSSCVDNRDRLHFVFPPTSHLARGHSYKLAFVFPFPKNMKIYFNSSERLKFKLEEVDHVRFVLSPFDDDFYGDCVSYSQRLFAGATNNNVIDPLFHFSNGRIAFFS